MPTTASEENIKHQIKEQIAFNSGKNLLAAEQINSLQFIEVSQSLIETIKNMDVESEKEMIDFLTDEALQEFCRVNQYFSFNSGSVKKLKAIYSALNQRIRGLNTNANQSELDDISQDHYIHLCNWLVQTNSFAGKMYSGDQEYAIPVACSEYPSDLQMNILNIKLEDLIEPVLDIGCGRELNLVNYLRDNGIEAYGIDRFDNENPFYTKTDWLEYNFEMEKWGSLISNLGFSNHFIHHNQRVDGNYREYAQKYMDILSSLKIGGSFYYAPDLPFIEKHLDSSKYHYTGNTIEGYVYKSIRITRI